MCQLSLYGIVRRRDDLWPIVGKGDEIVRTADDRSKAVAALDDREADTYTHLCLPNNRRYRRENGVVTAQHETFRAYRARGRSERAAAAALLAAAWLSRLLAKNAGSP